LPNHVDNSKNSISWNDCHQLRFYFNPTEETSAFHINRDREEEFNEGQNIERGVDASCFSRYHLNIIASIADMMILAKARTYIGEYNSNWGRVIRTIRVRLNTLTQDDSGVINDVDTMMVQGIKGGLSKTLDTKIAWGSTREKTLVY